MEERDNKRGCKWSVGWKDVARNLQRFLLVVILFIASSSLPLLFYFQAGQFARTLRFIRPGQESEYC